MVAGGCAWLLGAYVVCWRTCVVAGACVVAGGCVVVGGRA